MRPRTRTGGLQGVWHRESPLEKGTTPISPLIKLTVGQFFAGQIIHTQTDTSIAGSIVLD